MKKSFLEKLRENILVCDGAMGTFLFQKGIPADTCFEALNLENSQLIAKIHQEYIDAGAQIIETNTFAANRTKLKRFGLENKTYLINKYAAQIANSVTGKEIYVAGSIGPLAKTNPENKLSSTEIAEIYQEQITALLEGNIDLFILETFSDLEQILIALDICKKLSKLPVICQMAFTEGGKTAFGINIETIVRELHKHNADVIGANCGSGPANMLEVVREITKITDRFVSAQPNAGYPQIIDGRTMYLSSEQYFANYARLFIEAGANIIGGCCGTTPKHIKAIADIVKNLKPKREFTIFSESKKYTKESTSLIEKKISNNEFTVVVEMSPPKNPEIAKYIENAIMLKNAGAEILSFPDNPLAQIRMNPISIASIIKSKVGIETIFHLTCRDRNLIALNSDLLGASALNLNMLLAVTGDPSSIGSTPEATSVFDVDSIKLVELVSNLNKNFNLNFYTGVAFNPNVNNLDYQIERLKKKISAGANFVMTQPLFSKEKIISVYEKTKLLNVPILFGIMPLVSKKNTEFLHNEVPGIQIPDEIRKRMDIEDKQAAISEGISIALELITAIKNIVKGIYLIPPLGKYEIAAKILNHIF